MNNLIKKSLHILKTKGFLGLLQKIKYKFRSRFIKPYIYKSAHLTNEIKLEMNNFQSKPLISIIMPVYNVNPKWLNSAIQSIENQWYENWELCIADDKSTNEDTIDYLQSIDNNKIKIVYLEKNLNISAASNKAISLAKGEYIALLDNDDELTTDALYEMVKAINEFNPDIIYSDEDSITTKGRCIQPHFKPDYSPDLLLTHNYITHFTVIKKTLLDQVGLFNSKFDGAQDHDLFLRLVEQTTSIHHIAKVLYHWRIIPTSTNSNPHAKPEALDNAKLVIEETLKRRNIQAEVTHMEHIPYFFKIKRAIIDNPLVSIIIPFKDKPELLKMSIESILSKSTYNNFEIIGISNNSTEQATFSEMTRLEELDNRITFHEYNVPFNFSKINNYAVNTFAKGEHIILLNNDIEIITPSWIEYMLEHSQRDDVGCVGAKLYYPNDTIQHAGVIIGIGDMAGHSHKCLTKDNFGYFNRSAIVQNISAVTAACCMVKYSLYKEIGGLDEENLSVAFNDVDFCLRIRELGYLNIFTPFAEAYHHESISRGYEDTEEKILRFEKEVAYMKQRHKDIMLKGDPYYNPNLTLEREDFTLK